MVHGKVGLRVEPDPRQGYESAASGSEGIDKARKLRPTVVLLDLHLPDMTGEEVAQALVNDPATKNIPIIVISADATEARKKSLLSAGAKAYFTKPFDVAVFKRTVGKYLSAAEAQTASVSNRER